MKLCIKDLFRRHCDYAGFGDIVTVPSKQILYTQLHEYSCAKSLPSSHNPHRWDIFS
jgi:hypothetical protein